MTPQLEGAAPDPARTTFVHKGPIELISYAEQLQHWPHVDQGLADVVAGETTGLEHQDTVAPFSQRDGR